MQHALYDPKHGYYTTQNPFKDFTTAPELTPLFGEVIAVWLTTTWQEISHATGHTNFNLIECGPGRGTLMSDALRTLKKIAPDVYSAAKVHLVETSPTLTKTQQETLQDHTITWHTDIKTVPNNAPAILIANEFLDAFPIDQFERINGHWQERHVDYTKSKGFHFTTKPTKIDTNTFPTSADFHETSTAQNTWITDLSEHFNTQAMATLFIDYAITGGDTLQALKHHQFVPVLEHIGTADLTAHVNFNRIKTYFEQAHIIDFSTFLTQYGLPLRLNGLLETANEPTKQELMRVAERLMSPNHMGTLFKCLLTRQNY